MARKKKQSRKFKPKNEFGYNMAYTSNRYSEYVFVETNTMQIRLLYAIV